MKKLFPILVCAFAALFLSGCGSPETETEAEAVFYPYSILCTTGMITDIVRQVAGDKAGVEGMIGPGVDPHLYQPTRSDVVALQNADLVFYNGLHLEGKMGDVLVRIARDGKPVYAVTEELSEKGGFLLSDEEGATDPHVWMDVSAWSAAVEVVAEALAKYDPAHAEYYQKNAAAYQERLSKLDAYAEQAIASIPEKRRVLVTAHDAFNYLGKAYGIEVRGVQGLSTESEAGLRDIEELKRFLVQNDIPAVFVESSVSDKNVRALVEGARDRGHELTIGGELFSDAMGPSGSYEGTYIGMIDHNVTTIAKALGGDVPARGMQGKLSPAD